MAYAYHIYRVDPVHGEPAHIIRVEHIFYGHTKAECSEEFRRHLGACSGLSAAENEDRIEEYWEEIDVEEIPVPSDEEDDDDT